MARQGSGSIVVGYADGTSESALAWAAKEADRAGHRLTLLHALAGEARRHWSRGDHVPGVDHVERRAEENAVSEISDVAERVRAQYPDLDVTTAFVHDHAGRTLVVATRDATVLVVGADRAGSESSETLESVLARADCTVVVVPAAEARVGADGEPDGEPDNPPLETDLVVVGVDDPGQSQDAIGYAFSWADSRRGRVRVVSTTSTAAQAETLATWRASYPSVTAEEITATDALVDELCRLAQSAELVVISAGGHGRAARHRLRSNVEVLLKHTSCPTVVVRPRGSPSG